jgi:DNA-binding protein H-NS
MDLDTLSLHELKDLQAQVGRAITSYEGRRKRAAVTDLEERARALGFSLGELVGIETVRRRRPALAKYANPSNASETWSGRGRRPRWLGSRPIDFRHLA